MSTSKNQRKRMKITKNLDILGPLALRRIWPVSSPPTEWVYGSVHCEWSPPIVIRPKDVLWYPVSRTIFIGMTWNFFYGHFRPPEIQIYQKKNVCDSVTLWFCHSVIGNIPNKVSIPKYYPIITKFCTVVHLGGISRWFFVFFEFPIFTPPGGTLVFFWHTKISKFPQISSNLHEIWHKSVSSGFH